MDVTACVSCETDPTCFRAVVDLATRRECGVVCVACLTEQFGDTIRSPVWRYDDGCALCDRDACYALAAVSLHRESKGCGYATSRFEYELGDATLSVCDEHGAWLALEGAALRPVVADGGV